MNEQPDNQSPIGQNPVPPAEPTSQAPRGTSFVLPPSEPVQPMSTPQPPAIAPQAEPSSFISTPPLDSSLVPEPEMGSLPEANPEEDMPELYAADGQEAPLSWQASEYVHHQKGAAWYIGLIAIMSILLIVAVIFKLWLSVGVFIAMGAAIAVYAHKAPRVLTYSLDDHNVMIESHAYPYKNFRSFAVLSDVEWHAIDLEPTQRFMPRLTLLFSDEDFEAIVGHLSLHLPRTDRKPDFIERATRYLRF